VSVGAPPPPAPPPQSGRGEFWRESPVSAGAIGGRAIPVRRSAALKRSSLAVAALVLVLYGIWISIILFSGHDAREWINFGSDFVDRPHALALMHVDPHGPLVRKGFGIDGQFYYFIAVDPVNAQYFEDDPAYRYKRIVYPMLARALALGQARLIPYTMILINWLAVAGGTLAVAAWLKRKAVSPWLALIYGLYPGMFLAFQRDYTEPLSYALMALAVYLYSFGGKRQLLGAPLCFALAALTRDKVLAFAFFYGAGLLLADFAEWGRRTWVRELMARVPRAAIFGAIVGVPVGLYQLFLKYWLHTLPAATGQLSAPLTGASALSWRDPNLYLAFIAVIMPAVVCTGMGLWAVWRRLWRLEVFALLITIQLSITVANGAYWKDVPGGLMRLSIAVLLLALYCVPIFDRLNGGRRWWLWSSAGGWLILLVAFGIYGPILFVQQHL
jgi:hypothetical protein